MKSQKTQKAMEDKTNAMLKRYGVLKKSRKELEQEVWQSNFVIITMLVLIFVGSVWYTIVESKAESQAAKNICIPQVSGIYTPLDKGNYTIVVLDNRIALHKQLATEIERVLGQINNQLGGKQ